MASFFALVALAFVQVVLMVSVVTAARFSLQVWSRVVTRLANCAGSDSFAPLVDLVPILFPYAYARAIYPDWAVSG